MTCVHLLDSNVERGDVLWMQHNPGGYSMSVVSVNRLVGYIGSGSCAVPDGCHSARELYSGELLVERVEGDKAFCREYAKAV
jgi:hypothetical protein